MKTLKELAGVKVLSKNEQKSITGGIACRAGDNWCPSGSYCCIESGLCRPNGKVCF